MSDHRTKPGSPGEVLEHHGVKGMRWGVRKQDETSGRDGAKQDPPSSDVARRNEQMKRSLSETAATKNATNPQESSSSGAQTSKHQHIDGLTPNQKKALIATGVVTVGVVGFIAYKHYAGGSLSSARPAEFDVSGLAKGPLSKQPLGQLGKGHAMWELKNPSNLMVDTSRGYADIQHTDGFKSAYAKMRHDELIKTLDQMRERFPAVRNMNIEVVPMSEVQGMDGLVSQKCPAAVMGLGKGEARVMFNDAMHGLTSEEAGFVKDIQPGAFTKNFLGNHEMGHLLAVAHGELPPTDVIANAFDNVDYSKRGGSMAAVKVQQNWMKKKDDYHKELFKKHGFTYKELSGLSKYAATEPAEALAELSGHYFTPETRAKMSPSMVKRAEALFNDMGGVTSSGSAVGVAKSLGAKSTKVDLSTPTADLLKTRGRYATIPGVSLPKKPPKIDLGAADEAIKKILSGG